MRFIPDEILKKKMLDTFVDKNDVLMTVDDRQKTTSYKWEVRLVDDIVDSWEELE